MPSPIPPGPAGPVPPSPTGPVPPRPNPLSDSPTPMPDPTASMDDNKSKDKQAAPSPSPEPSHASELSPDTRGLSGGTSNIAYWQSIFNTTRDAMGSGGSQRPPGLGNTPRSPMDTFTSGPHMDALPAPGGNRGAATSMSPDAAVAAAPEMMGSLPPIPP